MVDNVVAFTFVNEINLASGEGAGRFCLCAAVS